MMKLCMNLTHRLKHWLAQTLLLSIALTLGVSSWSQVPERTIDEIKVEAQARANRGGYPMGGLDPKDVEQALSLIKTRDGNDWAYGWSQLAQSYLQEAQKSTDNAKAAQAYKRAWRLFYMAQWPVPNSDGKKKAYADALSAYARYAQTLDPPLQVVQIPFEGKTFAAYLRMPKNQSKKVPMILAISGLDSRKETVADSYAEILNHGVGFLAVDSPGTGQAPVKVNLTAERMFSAALDYLARLPEVDTSRIIVSGVSFGGYWASKLAIVERSRLLGSVAQSPPIDQFFTEKFLREDTMGNKEYLFDLAPAFINVFEGAQSIDDLARLLPPMSLKTMGLMGKPTAPMLVVGGVKDTQVPIVDLELLMRSGDVPKESWINPQGGHLGREAKGWTDPVIFSKVIIPWELRLLESSYKK
jgi:hypothetical protein